MSKHLRILGKNLSEVAHSWLTAHFIVATIILVIIALVAKRIRHRLGGRGLLRCLRCARRYKTISDNEMKKRALSR